MTREQIQELLATIQVAFPNFNPKDKKATTNLWLMMLSEYTYEQVSLALREYILTEKTGFAPSIGQLTNLIKAQKEQKYFEELEQMLIANVCNGIEMKDDKALEMKHEGVPMPEKYKERLEDMRNGINE